MKIQYVSDLHLEFPKNRQFLEENSLKTEGDILILAGDIILDKQMKKAESFFNSWRLQYKQIIQIPGNHEFYDGEILYAYPDYYKELASNHIKVNNKTIKIENIRFICSTLWTNIPFEFKNEFETKSNDYKLIYYSKKHSEKRHISIEDTNFFHSLSVDFIKKELTRPFSGKTILVTHQLPSFDLINESDKNYLINHYCASDLTSIYRNYDIDLWIFGHYHRTVDKKINNTRFVSNPLGYMDEKQKEYFSRSAIIEV
ncbi:metallophosphoesterase [Leptospira vanthielii]|nr:metallophosphoesterase [Leptospira vanthielii]